MGDHRDAKCGSDPFQSVRLERIRQNRRSCFSRCRGTFDCKSEVGSPPVSRFGLAILGCGAVVNCVAFAIQSASRIKVAVVCS
jgi:hypothetical protein